VAVQVLDEVGVLDLLEERGLPELLEDLGRLLWWF